MAEFESKLNQLMALMQEMKQGQTKMMEEGKQGQEEMMAGIVNLINTKVDIITKKLENLERNDEKFDKKFDTIEERFKMLERDIGYRTSEESERVIANQQQTIYGSFQRVPEGIQHSLVMSNSDVKLSTYDGKTSWKVYKTQLTIVAEVNGWDTRTKDWQLAASLRGEAADILRTVQVRQTLNVETLLNPLELLFGEKCSKDYSRLQLKSRQQKPNETLQELATDVERLAYSAFSNCPPDVRETVIVQYFIYAIRDFEIQKVLRLDEVQDLQSALICGLKVEAAQQTLARDRHPIRGFELNHMDQTRIAMTKAIAELRNMLYPQRYKPEENSLHCTLRFVTRRQKRTVESESYRRIIARTRVTSSLILYGGGSRLPSVSCRDPDASSSPIDNAQLLLARLKEVHALARERMDTTLDKMESRHDEGVPKDEFTKNDKFWFWDTMRGKELYVELQRSLEERQHTVLK